MFVLLFTSFVVHLADGVAMVIDRSIHVSHMSVRLSVCLSIYINVGVELALDEVVVGEGNLDGGIGLTRRG